MSFIDVWIECHFLKSGPGPAVQATRGIRCCGETRDRWMPCRYLRSLSAYALSRKNMSKMTLLHARLQRHDIRVWTNGFGQDLHHHGATGQCKIHVGPARAVAACIAVPLRFHRRANWHCCRWQPKTLQLSLHLPRSV